MVDSVSCASAGNCAAGGRYATAPLSPRTDNLQPFVVSEVKGVWGTAEVVPGTAAHNVSGESGILSVSCASAGNCDAGGYYQTGNFDRQAFVVNETGGTWGTAREIAGPGAFGGSPTEAAVASVSCPAAGNCAAGGYYGAAVGNSEQHRPFVVNETGGTWRTAEEVPEAAALLKLGWAEVNAVSCASPGRCSAGGDYTGGSGGFLVDESAGTWGAAHAVPPIDHSAQGNVFGIEALSCVPTGACSAGGSFVDVAPQNQAFVIDKLAPRPTRAVLSLSAARVTHGHEQAERVSVVMSGSGAAPAGNVTIKAGKTVVCVLKLASGKGSCRPTATRLKAGTYHLTAAYGGNADFAPSVSAARTLTVLK